MSASHFGIATSDACLQPNNPKFTSFRTQLLSFHILLKSCVCKLFRFTYFPKTMHLCQNNGFQSLQNHILTHAVSPTPLESHTSKIRGWGEGGNNPARIVILSERSESKDPSAT